MTKPASPQRARSSPRPSTPSIKQRRYTIARTAIGRLSVRTGALRSQRTRASSPSPSPTPTSSPAPPPTTYEYTLSSAVPLHVYRAKSTPTVACASFRDYVLTVGNGPASSDGSTRLQYSIRNLKTDTAHQSEDTLPLPPNSKLTSLFFSDAGDPHIYDSSGTLLVLLHWRTPAQAQWVPLLDTRTLARRSGGRKEEENYWPVAVAGDRFYCIVLKGGERYPYFPRPLLSDFDFCVPIRDPAPSGDAPDEGDANHKLEEAHLRLRVLHALLADAKDASTSRGEREREKQTVLATTALDIDKSILQLLAAECVAGDQMGMKCMELVGLFKDASGKMLEAAGKVAGRFGRTGVRERVREVEDRRAVGLVGGESDEDEDGGGAGMGDEM